MRDRQILLQVELWIRDNSNRGDLDSVVALASAACQQFGLWANNNDIGSWDIPYWVVRQAERYYFSHG